jgi:hypothetical protein
MKSLQGAQYIHDRIRQIADGRAGHLDSAKIEADETPDALRKLQAMVFELADAVALMAKEREDTLRELRHLR